MAAFLPTRRDMSSSPDRASTTLELWLGRTLAACVHPVAAWRSGSRSAQFASFCGYLVASYLIVLVMLIEFLKTF